jgi:hypothetical protein
METLTVVPAYNREYTRQEEIIRDWESGKDFQIDDVGSKFNGSYINKEDAIAGGIESVKVRYAKLCKACIIKL